MKKNIMNKNIEKMSHFSSKFPKTINEAINFNEAEDIDYMTMDDEIDVPTEEIPQETSVEDAPREDMSADALLSDIRKKSLKGMAMLADTPEDPNYEMLKKIFLMLDKGVSEKQEQREVLAKNPNAKQM